MSLVFNRVSALPAVLEADSIYAVKRAEPGMLDLYFTGKTADDLLRIASLSDIAAPASGTVRLVQSLAQLNQISDAAVELVYVIDPSPTPGQPQTPCWFYKDSALDTFIKAPLTQAVSASWADLIGKPQATPEQIDSAVQAAHQHENLELLNKFQKDANGALTYEGRCVMTVIKNEW